MSRGAKFLLLLAPLLGGCDQFFTVHGRVTECGSGEPITGVRVRTTLRGGDEEQEDFTDPSGHYVAFLNEPPTAEATLVYEKPTFVSAERSFEGAPERDVDVCLQPVVE
jgi:hypothetical protein